MRITHATQIMENPKLSISQVADESGFSDRVYFGKVFSPRDREDAGTIPAASRQPGQISQVELGLNHRARSSRR